MESLAACLCFLFPLFSRILPGESFLLSFDFSQNLLIVVQ